MAAADLAAAAGEETDASSAESPDTSPENVRREEGEAAAVGEDKQEAKEGEDYYCTFKNIALHYLVVGVTRSVICLCTIYFILSIVYISV